MPPPKIPKKVLDIIKAQRAELARLVPAHRRAIIEAAASVQRDLLARLQALDQASFSAQEVRARLVEVGAIVDATGRDYGVKVGNAAKDVATIAAGISRDGLVEQLVAWAPKYKDSIRRVGTVAKAAGVLDAGLLEYHESSKATYGLEAIQKMRASMSRSALAGETMAQAWPKMAQQLAIPEWRAERIVRTEQAFAANRSELQQIEAMYGKKGAREGFRKQLITTFDQRTGDDSVSVHEQVRELDKPFQDNAGREYQHPPNRPNDREVMLIIPAPDDDYEAILGQLEGMTDEEQDAFVGRELEAAMARLQGGGGEAAGGGLLPSIQVAAAVSAPPLAAIYTKNYRDSVPNEPYPNIDRKSPRYIELGSDPASKSFREAEAEVVLLMEEAGRWASTVRDPTGGGDFIVDGIVWDLKGFVSGIKPRKGGFTIQRAIETIERELGKGRSVLVDTRRMSSHDIASLRDEIEGLKLAQPMYSKVEFFP